MEQQEEHTTLFQERLAKLQEIQKEGLTPYSLHFQPEHTTHELLRALDSEFSEEITYSLAGRIRSKRLMGKAAFFDLEDASGKIQLYISKDTFPDGFRIFKYLDIGDIIGIRGFLFRTRTKQITLHVQELYPLAKCLRPLPAVKETEEKTYHSFQDQEQRYRQRYVDLMIHPHIREKFINRSRIISLIREFLTSRGFLEVETPMMHPIPGGATAKPFVTQHHSLGLELYLRIAPELYLKRLLVGGFPKVFEINRNFRNEGISTKHNPEFTMLELYESYSNIDGMLSLCEELITFTVEKISGSMKISYGDHTLDFTPPWEKISYLDSIEKFSGIKLNEKTLFSDVFKAIQKLEEIQKSESRLKEISQFDNIWEIADMLFDIFVEPKLIQPTFIIDFPSIISPLAKSWPERPEFAQRFEPYIAGRELGNAFSEQNDPIEQKKRFQQQAEDKSQRLGNEEVYIDHDYIRALEYGMPPAGGLGIGIDRLVMILNQETSIRDTILFPLLRPEAKT